VARAAVGLESLGRRQLAFVGPPQPVQFYNFPVLVHLGQRGSGGFFAEPHRPGARLSSPQRALDSRRFRKWPPYFNGVFAVQNFFSLKLFFDFLIFRHPERRFLEAIMMTGELFAVAVLLSILFAHAAHWQNDNDGGLT
jgi:hypothetical protein